MTSSYGDPPSPPPGPSVPPPPIVSPDERFYWDGDKWVPVPQSGAVSPASAAPSTRLPTLSWNVGNVAALIGAFLIAVGCFLPWAVVGFVTVSGIEAAGGWLFVVGAVVIAVTASLSIRGFVGIGIGLSLIVFGGAVGVGLASEYTNLNSVFSTANASGLAVASAGVGLGVVALGTAVVVFAGVYELIRFWSDH